MAKLYSFENLKPYESQKWLSLLHFNKGKSAIQKDSYFFLAKDGYKNAKNEFEATVKMLENAIKNNDKTMLCKYPARSFFIAKQRQDETVLRAIKECEEVQDYLKIVAVDEIYLNFAAESTRYLASTMGHIFLELRGFAKEDFNKSVQGELVSFKKDSLRSYAISYYAILSDYNPFDYAKALSGNLQGYYALNLYEDNQVLYLKEEQRSIYRLKLKFSEDELMLFRLHLFELKNVNVHYSFISHNCTDGIANILAVLNEAYAARKIKPFITPIDYIKDLKEAALIEDLSIEVPENKKTFYQKQGYNDIFSSIKASKISLSFSNTKQFSLQAYPVYSSIKDTSFAYKEFSESRLLSFELRSGKDKFFLNSLELLHLFSINDFIDTRAFSKYLNLSFKSNLYDFSANSYQPSLNEDTKAYPQLEFGFGLGHYYKNLSFYVLPLLSYRYERIHNPYLALQGGFILAFWDFKFQSTVNKYFDFKQNNRGYDFSLENFLALAIFKDSNVFLKHNLYSNDDRKIYKKRSENIINLGFAVNF